MLYITLMLWQCWHIAEVKGNWFSVSCVMLSFSSWYWQIMPMQLSVVMCIHPWYVLQASFWCMKCDSSVSDQLIIWFNIFYYNHWNFLSSWTSWETRFEWFLTKRAWVYIARKVTFGLLWIRSCERDVTFAELLNIGTYLLGDVWTKLSLGFFKLLGSVNGFI